MAKTSPATEELNLAPKYNVQMLHALEHFLSKDKAQTGLIQNLIKDYQPKITITKAARKDQQVSTPGSISWGTIWKVAKSFIKAPVQTYRLLSFYQNQEKYNTNEFQQALIKSDKTWKFVDNTVDNLENINTLMVNMGVDLFHEGNPLDNKGMKHLQSALKTPEVTTALKDLAISSLQPSANNMELASKLLDMISKAPSINSYLTEKGPSIQFYIQNSVASKIEQDAEKLQQWNNLPKNEIGLEGKAFEQAKRKFLQKASIAGEALDIAIRDGSLPNGLENNLAQYGLGKQDISKILEIVPVLLTSPNELKQILDAVNAGQYSDIARQVIDLAESKPEIKEYLDNNKETFGKIIVSMMKDHKQFSESGLGGQVYELVPALLNNPTAIKEVIGLYDKSEYYEIAPKIFDLVAKDPSIKDYFSKNAQGFEALINNVVTSNIKTSQEALAEENQAWMTLSPEGKKNYLDTNETWKDVSDFAKERMLTKGKLQDFGDTLEIYGIEKDDISTLSHLVMMTFNSPSNLSGVLSTFAKSDYTGMTKDIFRLFEESPEINTYLKEEKAFIARVVKANLLYSPDLQEIDVTDLVPFLLEHPKELSNIVKLVQEEKYSEIAPQILKLSQEDRGIADYLELHTKLY